MMHQVCSVSVGLLTAQSRSELLLRRLDGDTGALASQMNRAAACVALCDFLVSPSAGALSDRIGRRPLMIAACAVAVPFKAMAAIRPTASILFMERVFCDAMRTVGGTTMAYACLSDLHTGDAYTQALTRLSGATGTAIVIAPLVAAWLDRRGPRFTFAVAALLSSVQFVLSWVLLKETHIKRGRPCEQPASLVRPVWHCIRLFTSGARLRVRTCLFTLHCFLEGKVLQEQVAIMQLAAGWGSLLRSRWSAGLGAVMLAGSKVAGFLLRCCGEHGFLALCHAASFGAFATIWQSAFWSGLGFLSLGQQRRSASISWVITAARQNGVGHGEVIGWTASLRAVVDFFAALAYGVAHRVAGQRGRPNDVMYLPLVVTLLAEFVRLYLLKGRCVDRHVRDQ